MCQEFESFDEKMAKLLEHSLSEHATTPNEYLMQTEMQKQKKMKITSKQQSSTPGITTFLSAKHLWPKWEAVKL